MASRGSVRKLWHFISFVLLLFFVCEFAIYYLVMLRCTWPSLDEVTADQSVKSNNEAALRVMLFADTHLLGYARGHWFDKLRREWQMQRAFQTCLSLHNPEVVFVLGDLFDEGKWCSDEEFADHLDRFKKMFAHASSTNMQVVVGNHDVGFHYSITTHKLKRFQKSFKDSPVRKLHMRGSIFVTLNSMAFEGDRCKLCQEADQQLSQIKKELDCSKKRQGDSSDMAECQGIGNFPYSKPILLQHFPMFRTTDENCTGPDSAPLHLKYERYKPKYDCLSKEATSKLLSAVHPRLVIDGHSHHFCRRTLTDGTPEWTIPSFSWRNINSPSFLLAVISNNNYAINKCYLPEESTVINMYIGGGTLIGLWTLVQLCRQCQLNRTRRVMHYKDSQE